MYGYYDNECRFSIKIQQSHAPEGFTEEWKPVSTGGGHGGGDEALREEFYQLIKNGERPDWAMDSAYYSTALAICAEESIHSGQPVTIPGLA
jgi:hypothetical protein